MFVEGRVEVVDMNRVSPTILIVFRALRKGLRARFGGECPKSVVRYTDAPRCALPAHMLRVCAQLFATILDPRYHKLRFTTADIRAATFEAFVGYLNEKFPANNADDAADDDRADARGAGPEASIDHLLFDGSAIYGHHAGGVAALQRVPSRLHGAPAAAPDVPRPSPVIREWNLYQTLEDIDKSSNILDWWRTQQVNFPRLAKLARVFLCIPASSAPSERTFSHLNIVVSKRRNRILPERAERHLVLKLNGELEGAQP
jgi:hypothetical protein